VQNGAKTNISILIVRYVVHLTFWNVSTAMHRCKTAYIVSDGHMTKELSGK
jgi:hypothetical protein